MTSRHIIAIGISLAAAGCERGGETPHRRPAQRQPEVARSSVVADAGAAVAPRAPQGPPPAPLQKPSAKGDCSVAHAPRPDRDPWPMCAIPGGRFTMGGPDAELDGAPPREVELSPYLIDQFEVTLAQYVHFLNATGTHTMCPSAKFVSKSCVLLVDELGTSNLEKVDGVYRVRPGRDPHLPVEAVQWRGAKLYCEWAGRRLPTEAEWEMAARFDPRRRRALRFPWGDRFLPRRTNCHTSLCKLEGVQLRRVGSFDGTGGLGDGTSPTGVHDLAGNVSEWVADCYAPLAPCDGACADPLAAEVDGCDRVMRGRGNGAGLEKTLAGARRFAIMAEANGISEGFRCASDPPASNAGDPR